MSVEYLFDKYILAGCVFQNGELVRYEREDKTEPYVVIPPAYVITDSDGACWTFGNEYAEHNGEYEFNVLRNAVDMDEVAKRIEYRRGRIWIFGNYGWKHFSRTRRSFI
jgi:hypothetical protein